MIREYDAFLLIVFTGFYDERQHFRLDLMLGGLLLSR